jgi:hypothetical protein
MLIGGKYMNVVSHICRGVKTGKLPKEVTLEQAKKYLDDSEIHDRNGSLYKESTIYSELYIGRTNIQSHRIYDIDGKFIGVSFDLEKDN